MTYQVWLGGSHNQTRVATEYEFKVKFDDLGNLFTNLFTFYKAARLDDQETFGDFCYRAGKDRLSTYVSEMDNWDADGKNS